MSRKADGEEAMGCYNLLHSRSLEDDRGGWKTSMRIMAALDLRFEISCTEKQLQSISLGRKSQFTLLLPLLYV